MAKGKTKPAAGPSVAVAVATPKPAVNVPALIIPNKRAMSLDIGPRFVAEYQQTENVATEATAALFRANTKRVTLLSNLTLAVVKAAKADPKAIDLSHVVNRDADAKKNPLATNLYNAIMIAVGLRQAVEENGHIRTIWADNVKKYFPSPADPKDAPETVRKRTFESNLRHQLKKVVQGALYIHEKNVQATLDKESGALRITGPDVKKSFGVESVVLNEKQTIKQSDGADLKLKEKPSFTAIADKGVRSVGGAGISRTSNNRSRKPGEDKPQTNISPSAVLDQFAVSLVSTIEKLRDKLTEENKANLRKVANAIAVAMPEFNKLDKVN